jgi:hypothetical protein
MAATAYRPGSALTASPAEIARRNGISPAKTATGSGPPPAARPAQASAGQPVISPLTSDMRPPPELKGAVKVAKFPSPSQYPFREIADDGGIWRLDPAAYTWRGKPVAAASIRQAAMNWASKEGYSVKTVLDGGHVYLQFTPKGGE